MEILNQDLYSLRNEAHFQFQTEFCDTVVASNPETLKIKSEFDAYLPLYRQEEEALNKIMKSAITEDIWAADKGRDFTFRGLAGTNRSAQNHFNAEIAVAAKRLQIVFDRHGNLTQKTFNEETASIHSLLLELKGDYAADVETVQLGDWVQELDANNRAFDALMKERYDESAARSSLVLKEVRKEVDAAYRNIVKRINALAFIEGGEVYDNFILRMNVVVEKYNSLVAGRRK
jgi:hypothetical protein